MNVQMRNKQTGEIRDVEADSPEFRELRLEVTTDGQTRWEQTSYEHADQIKERATYGELLDEDLGTDHHEALRHVAIELDLSGVAPENNPHLSLTPGEIEAGMTPQSKLDDLKAMYADGQAPSDRQGVIDEAADLIADERKDRGPDPALQAQGMRARAGGTDERDNVPVADANQSSGAASSSGQDAPKAPAPAAPTTSTPASSGSATSSGSGA